MKERPRPSAPGKVSREAEMDLFHWRGKQERKMEAAFCQVCRCLGHFPKCSLNCLQDTRQELLVSFRRLGNQDRGRQTKGSSGSVDPPIQDQLHEW